MTILINITTTSCCVSITSRIALMMGWSRQIIIICCRGYWSIYSHSLTVWWRSWMELSCLILRSVWISSYANFSVKIIMIIIIHAVVFITEIEEVTLVVIWNVTHKLSGWVSVWLVSERDELFGARRLWCFIVKDVSISSCFVIDYCWA